MISTLLWVGFWLCFFGFGLTLQNEHLRGIRHLIDRPWIESRAHQARIFRGSGAVRYRYFTRAVMAVGMATFVAGLGLRWLR